MRRVDRYRWVSLLVVVIVILWYSGSLTAGWDWTARQLQQFGLFGEPYSRFEQSGQDQPKDAGERNIPAIQTSTLIVFETQYTPCSLEATEEFPADIAQVGQSREQFAMYNPEWTVVEFGSERVLAKRQVDDACEELMAHRTIKLRDGNVVVLFGTGGPHSPIMTETDIDVSRLLPGDRERLLSGIVVDKESEVWSILEGLRH